MECFHRTDMAFAAPVTLALLARVTAAAGVGDGDDDRPLSDPRSRQRDLYTQFVICCNRFIFASELLFLMILTVTMEQFLRQKWTSLYAARRRQRCAAFGLPELPSSFFGWIPVLYRISGEEVLQSAGLDAYVVRAGLPFLRFCLLNAHVFFLLVRSFCLFSRLPSDFFRQFSSSL